MNSNYKKFQNVDTDFDFSSKDLRRKNRSVKLAKKNRKFEKQQFKKLVEYEDYDEVEELEYSR